MCCKTTSTIAISRMRCIGWLVSLLKIYIYAYNVVYQINALLRDFIITKDCTVSFDTAHHKSRASDPEKLSYSRDFGIAGCQSQENMENCQKKCVRILKTAYGSPVITNPGIDLANPAIHETVKWSGILGLEPLNTSKPDVWLI